MSGFSSQLHYTHFSEHINCNKTKEGISNISRKIMKANMRLSYKFTIIFSFEILIKFVEYVLKNHEESQDPAHIQ